MGCIKLGDAEKKRISAGQSIAWNSVGSFSYLVANWLTTVLVVVLGSDYAASGVLAVAMAVGNLVATITLFNVRPYQVTDIGSQFAARDYVGFRFVTTAFSLLACSVYSVLTVSFDCFPVVAAYALFKAVDSFVDVLHGVDQLSDRLDYAGQSQIVRGILIVFSFVVGMVCFDSLMVSVLGMVFASLAVVLLFDVRRASQLDDVRPRFSLRTFVSICRSCFPGFASALLCAFVVSYSRQWYGYVCGSELLGIYAAIATPAVVVQAFAGYLYSPLLGPIAKMWRSADYKGIGKLIGRFFLMLLLAEAVCIVLFFSIGNDVFSCVYGEDILPYTNAMPPILICTGSTAVMVFFIDLLVSFRLNVAVVVSSLMACIACLLSVSGFVGCFGMNGISFCVIVSFFIGSITAAFFIAKAVIVNPSRLGFSDQKK